MKELKISEYSFHEFLQSFQTAVIEGYRLDLDSNERFPQSYGSHKEVTLVLSESNPVLILPTVPVTGEALEVIKETVENLTSDTETQEELLKVTTEVTPVKTRKGK